jgi:hypothetical protein
MNNEALTNPYRAALYGQGVAPFAGRTQALAWLHQHLFETRTVSGLLFTGRRNIGKTSLLQNLNAAYDELFVGVVVPLENTVIQDESDWLLLLAQNATAEIAERGFPLTRLSTLEPPADDVRAWFANDFLPEALATVRPQRRLAFLIDDAQELVRAADEGRLEPEPFLYMRNLLEQHRQLAFVLTVGSEHDAAINELSPLVRRSDVFRLNNLTVEDTADLLQNPVASLYQVPEPTAAAIYRATGGIPLLLQLFGAALYWRWEEEPNINVMTADDARMVTAAVAKRADELFEEVWQKLKQNERLVLSAVSHLVYRDPLRAVDIASIEAWLIETDYPLDRIAIGSAIRSLEYEELVSSGSNGISLGSGLLQSWLLENSTLSPLQASEPQDNLPAESRIRRLQLIIAGLALIVVAVLMLVALSNSPRPDEPRILQPTVTLVGGS